MLEKKKEKESSVVQNIVLFIGKYRLNGTHSFAKLL